MLYTTVLHAVRKQLGLSCNEYCIADIVYHFSNNPKAPVLGWCSASRGKLADDMGVSKRTVQEIIKTLETKGLIERNTETEYVRTTAKWYDMVVAGKAEIKQPKKEDTPHAETAPPMQEVHPPHAESSRDGGAESSPNNKSIDNNNYNQQQPAGADDAVVAAIEAFDFDIVKRKINEVRDEVMGASIFLEERCMTLKIPRIILDRLIHGFFDEQIALAQAKEPISYKGLRKHLKNWLPIQVRLGSVSKHHPQHNPHKPLEPVYGDRSPRNSTAFSPSNRFVNELT